MVLVGTRVRGLSLSEQSRDWPASPELVREPIKGLVETLAGQRVRREDIPVLFTVSQRKEVYALVTRNGRRLVRLIGEQHQRNVAVDEVRIPQDRLELSLGRRHIDSVAAVEDKDDAVTVTVEVFPGVPKPGYLLPEIKGDEGERTPLELLGVAAYGYGGREADHGFLARFQLVHDGRFAAVWKANDDDIRLCRLAAKQRRQAGQPCHDERRTGSR